MDDIDIRQQNLAICKHLGLDPETTGQITITWRPDALPAVSVERALKQGEQGWITLDCLTRYR